MTQEIPMKMLRESTMSTNQILTDKNNEQKVMSVLLNNGPTQAGVMVGIVNAVSQPFSQPSVLKAIHLVDWADSLPLFIAFVVSFLLAIYQTLVMQKTRISEALIVVPLVTGILFGMSLGANHLTADVINTDVVNESQVDSESVAQRLQLKKQLNELQKQIALLDSAHDKTQVAPPVKTRGINDITALQAATEDNILAEDKPVNNKVQSPSDNKTVGKEKLKQQIEELRKKMEAMEKARKKPKTRNLYRAW